MFSRESEIQVFLKVAEKIAGSPSTGLSKANINSLKQIIKKSQGFDGNDIQSWVTHISRPADRKRSGSSSRVVMPETTEKLVASLVSELESASVDSSVYEKLADKINKEHRSDTLKEVARSIVPGSKPTRKSDALRIIKAGRRSEKLAQSKQTEAQKSSPW